MQDETSLNHIAIIMDGNGRWANAQGRPRSYGHKKGAEVVIDVINKAKEENIKYVTLYVFSSENWGRPQEEIDYLFDLTREYFDNDINRLTKENVKIKVVGQVYRLPKDLQEKITEIEEISKDNNGITVTLAVSYGGRVDIVNACKEISKKIKDGSMDVDDIDEEFFNENLYTKGLPDPDIIIRTGGDQRISNFLLWQMAYSELFFLDKYWPDFTKDDLIKIINDFKNRNRRFGKV